MLGWRAFRCLLDTDYCFPIQEILPRYISSNYFGISVSIYAIFLRLVFWILKKDRSKAIKSEHHFGEMDQTSSEKCTFFAEKANFIFFIILWEAWLDEVLTGWVVIIGNNFMKGIFLKKEQILNFLQIKHGFLLFSISEATFWTWWPLSPIYSILEHALCPMDTMKELKYFVKHSLSRRANESARDRFITFCSTNSGFYPFRGRLSWQLNTTLEKQTPW